MSLTKDGGHWPEVILSILPTSAYLLAAYYHCYNTSGVSAHEYSGVVVWISFPASVQQELYHAFKLFTALIYNFRFWAAILANWWMVNLFWPYHHALPYLGKVTKAFPLTPRGYEMAAERMAWGNFAPPPINIWGIYNSIKLIFKTDSLLLAMQ